MARDGSTAVVIALAGAVAVGGGVYLAFSGDEPPRPPVAAQPSSPKEIVRVPRPEQPPPTPPPTPVPELRPPLPPEEPPARAADGGARLDAREIREPMRKSARAFRVCYERALKSNPRLGGRIEISFTIDANGRVVEAAARHDSIGEQSVRNCILSAVRRVRFPASPNREPITVNYPLLFRAAE
jgi:TonB family protein